MTDFKGTTKLPNDRVQRVCGYVFDRVGDFHNAVDTLYSIYQKKFKPKWYHRCLFINSLDDWLEFKYEYKFSKIKSLYIHIKNPRQFEKLATQYQDIYDIQRSKYSFDLYYLKFYEEYQQLKVLIKSTDDIYVTPEQMKFIIYIEERINGR